MRKIKEENISLDEMFDTRVKNVEFKNVKGGVEATFYLEPNTEINPNDFGVTYIISFGKIKPEVISASIGPGMKVMTSTLMFENSVTKMSTFESYGYKNVNQNIVFSTIAAVVIRYFEKNTKTQAITFTAAHQGLHKAYKILSKEAERKGPLKWANPTSSPVHYFIVREEIWKMYEIRLQQQGV